MKKLTIQQKKNLRAVADRIRTEPQSYDQGEWMAAADTPCGTVACIYGHAAAVAGYVRTHDDPNGYFVHRPGSDVEWTVLELADDLIGTTANWGYRFDDGYGDGYGELYDSTWLPKGYRSTHGKRALANRVADALEGLADGKTLAEVSA